MNKKIVFVLGVIVGGAVGSGVTYTVAKKKFETELNNQFKEMEEEFAMDMQKVLTEYGIQDEEPEEEDIPEDEESEETNDYTRRTSIVPPEKVVHENVEYSKMYKHNPAMPDLEALANSMMTNGVSDDESNEEVIVRHEQVPSYLDSEPYIISDDDFEDSMNTQEKITAIYYAANDVLCVEDTEEILDIEDTVGRSNLTVDNFGQKLPKEDRDRLIIRNLRLGEDFDIYLDERAFNYGEDY